VYGQGLISVKVTLLFLRNLPQNPDPYRTEIDMRIGLQTACQQQEPVVTQNDFVQSPLQQHLTGTSQTQVATTQAGNTFCKPPTSGNSRNEVFVSLYLSTYMYSKLV